MPGIHNGIGTTFRNSAFGGGPPVNPDFISTWQVSTSITLPLLSGGTYSGTIDWGDGSTSSLSYGNRTHSYSSGGLYTVTISGTIEGWAFNNTGSKGLIRDIVNWGDLTITTDDAFFNCPELTCSAQDGPIVTSASLFRCFDLCLKLTSIGDPTKWRGTGGVTDWKNFLLGENKDMIFNGDLNGLDVSGATTLYNFLGRNTLFNKPLNDWDVGNVENFGRTLDRCASFDQDISSWNIVNSIGFGAFLASGQLSTANYDLLLVGWEATLQGTFPNGAGYVAVLGANFGSSTYTLGSDAETARTSLVNNFNWVITDGGGV